MRHVRASGQEQVEPTDQFVITSGCVLVAERPRAEWVSDMLLVKAEEADKA